LNSFSINSLLKVTVTVPLVLPKGKNEDSSLWTCFNYFCSFINWFTITKVTLHLQCDNLLHFIILFNENVFLFFQNGFSKWWKILVFTSKILSLLPNLSFVYFSTFALSLNKEFVRSFFSVLFNQSKFQSLK